VIPTSFIQELLGRVDILDVVERYVPLKRAGANHTACCPFHNEKTPSFTVSPAKQFYHCFGCGAHGSAIGFLMEYSGLSYPDAIRELAERAGMPVPEQESFSGRHSHDAGSSLIETMLAAARFYREQLKASPRAIDYLKGRGVSGEIAARYALGYAPDGWQNLERVFPDYGAQALADCGLVVDHESGRRYDRFRDRIMFPIADAKGNFIGFGGRILGEAAGNDGSAAGPKYLNSPETSLFEKGRELYGMPQARAAVRSTGTVIVVEGYMDVVALAQHGVENTVATLGTATTSNHVQKLMRQAERVVFCFDGDSAGRKAARRALEASIEHLADNRTVAFLLLPEGHDPDSFVRAHGAAAFQERAADALPLSEFLLGELRSIVDLGTAEGRSRLVHEAKPILERIRAPLLRLQLVKIVAAASQITPQELEAACGLQTATAARTRPVRPLPRRKPSLTRTLLKIAMQKPEWTARLPLEMIEGAEPETEAVRAIANAVEHGDLSGGGFNVVFEHFRDTPHAHLLSDLVGEVTSEPFEEGAMEAVLNDAIERLRRAGIAREIDALTTKHRQSGLSAEEQRQLAGLLAQKQKLTVNIEAG
jgi:DNA primase